jgi:CubicO group peptidase (beta-lactamase class C family)
MADAGIPGLAVGIVASNHLLWAKGYGVEVIDGNAPVTADTRFCIGSCTKAFTAAALAVLVDEGKLEWDKPLRKILPGFRMHNEIATRCATLRDLILHRTGLPGHDFAYLTSPTTRAGLLRRLRYLLATAGFRTRFVYSNLMYVVAGAVLEHVAGRSWEDFVRERLFAPLGMHDSGFSAQQQDAPSGASGHCWLHGRIWPWLQPWHCGNDMRVAMGQASGPQGSIRSSVHDLCHWLIMHLNQGQVDGQVVLTPEQVGELHRPQILTGQQEREPGLFDSSYAMGWFCQPYRGNRWLWHMGAGEGQVASVSFMPDRKVGVVVLLNIEKPLSVASVVAFNAYDRLLGLDVVRWASRARPARLRDEATAHALQEPRRYKGMRISHADSRPFVGEYHRPGYDVVRVRRSSGRLEACYNALRFGMQPAGPNTFDLVPHVALPWWGKRPARFVPGEGGRMRAVAMPFEPAIPKLLFRRR